MLNLFEKLKMTHRSGILAAVLTIPALITWINLVGEDHLSEFRKYHTNGALKSVQFLNDDEQVHGEELRYSVDSKLIMKINWDRGHRSHQWEYWPNGKVRSEIYEDSDYQSISKEYPENKD